MSALSTEYLPSGVVVLTIDRPHRRNALDNQTVAELHTVLDEINGNPEVRALVITGAGGAFCAGADLKAQPEDFTATGATPAAALLGAVHSPVARIYAAQELMASAFEKIHRLRQPVIAAVDGAAVGGMCSATGELDASFAAFRTGTHTTAGPL
ncbi:enoyl-CoA hydratase-related protein [Nocardia rhamnosiphila]|uniref:enoyl-CoA hydratase/isomerase family protein n=1 Tax=Nocardia rhamnosiphila TaxID=426716 RepID=UPI003F4CCE77